MTEKWRCVVESLTKKGKITPVDFNFIDYESVVGKPAFLNADYYSKLINNAKKYEKYALTGGLLELEHPSGEDYSDKNFYAVFGVNSQDLLLAILLGQRDDDTYELVGFNPEFLRSQIEKDPKIILRIAVALVKRPNDWKKVQIMARGIKSKK